MRSPSAESLVGASPSRVRNRGHVDVCGVVIGGPAVLYALGAPTPPRLFDGVSRAGVLACLRVHVGMVLSPLWPQLFWDTQEAHAFPPTPTKLLDILIMFLAIRVWAGMPYGQSQAFPSPIHGAISSQAWLAHTPEIFSRTCSC